MALEFAAAVFRLPCAKECLFGKACAKKYEEGVCVPNISSFIKKQIYGIPSNIYVRKGEIKFRTSEPNGDISISDGSANISR